MKARVSEAGGWEVACPECGEYQTLPDAESTWDCEATPNCPGELTEPVMDADDYNDGDEVNY